MPDKEDELYEQAITMAFMLLLSELKGQAWTFAAKKMQEFPFNHYQLDAIVDSVNDTRTFLLRARNEKVC